MIFFNSQLMLDSSQVRLFTVSNPKAFENCDDHIAAVQIHVFEMVEKALENNEDVVLLIESYLQKPYNLGNSPQEYAQFIIASDQMSLAKQTLRENWSTFDPTLPEESYTIGGVGKNDAQLIYLETSLSSYLETLGNIYNR